MNLNGKNIARVFPTMTNMSPRDRDVYFTPPTLFVQKGDYDEVHISCAFTWDKERAVELQYQWQSVCKSVIVGGPAFNDPGNGFIPGLYLKHDVTITSRGCPNNCPWCYVPKREGKLREMEIHPGRIIQDNNLLACSKPHIRKVMAMLKTQKKIEFAGGLESDHITDEFVDDIRGLSIRHVWMAYDTPSRLKSLKKAINKLRKHLTRHKVRVYVMIGMKGDTIENAESRLELILELGAFPFAMRYRDDNGLVQKERAWNNLAKQYTDMKKMYGILNDKFKIKA